MEGILSLLEATEYEGLTIKEWNIVQFSKLSRIIAAIAKDYTNRGISWADFSKALVETDAMVNVGHNLVEFLAPFLEHAPAIITISCNVDQKFVDKLPYTKGIVAVLLIMKTNLMHLSGFFGTLTAKASSAEAEVIPAETPSPSKPA
jgi:hypothetical protein